ncbi:LCP family protein [Gulosibacter sp. 10]|uniref:LCP family protein n=1 Tax=Gulosibacter sp. 10 TaxID=1255570 RepID=UPI00097F6635|nr:LCP family protein [Gulosibacter sp. 10]SJM55270.1 Cell envelope-associated transcriptional attenuator LytR-CpsA-Psr, subfamily A1 (as in PMID19099556) [Gulosibacter sp. 10]
MPRRSAQQLNGRARPGGTVARHGRLRTTSAARSIGKGIAMSLGVLLVSVVAFGGIVWSNLQSGVETFDLADNSPETETGDIFEGGVNILLVGSDSRADEEGNIKPGQSEGTLNDVNMIFHLAEDHSSATVVSIPRDTIVNRPQCTSDEGEEMGAQDSVQINSILDNGGVNCIVSTVEGMSGIDIQYAAMIGFNGVIEMSNAVGGVDVCVENPIEDSYSDLYLDAGMHSLQGEEALKFLRTRHGVGDGSDLARINNQQIFLSALLRKVKENDTLTNPTKVYGLARAATQNMVLSSNLNSVDTLVSLANALAKVPLDQFSFVRLPVVDSQWQPGRVEPAYPAADEMWQLIDSDQPLNVGEDGTAEESEGEATEAPDESGDTGVEGETGVEGDTGTDTGVPDDSAGAEEAQPTETPTPAPNLDGQRADEESCSAGTGFF